MAAVIMKYADSSKQVRAQFVYTWCRGEVRLVSSSSGPKDYLKNRIYMAFESQPGVQKISMYVLNGVPFLLLHWASGASTDVTGKAVEVAA
jgi:hypothetical protein